MGYLYLCLACTFGLTKGYCGKKVSGFVKESRDAMLANSLRMGICVVIGFFFVVAMNGFSGFNIGGTGILISFISGVSNAVFVVSWLFAVNRGAYMLVDVFLTLGLIIPISLSTVFFGEEIRLNHYIGFAVLLIAVIIMCSYSSSVKSKIDLNSILLLSLSGVAQGFSSFTQKWFVRTLDTNVVSSFNFYTYVFSGAVLITAYLIMKSRKKDTENETQKFSLNRIWIYIVIMAVMLFLNSYFMTLAASKLDAVLLYPLSTGLGLGLSAAMSAVAFKEKITVRCIVGIVLAFAALLIINLL